MDIPESMYTDKNEGIDLEKKESNMSGNNDDLASFFS